MSVRTVRAGVYGLGLLMIVGSVAASLLAVPAIGAPEIDASSIASGIGLLTGGVLILRARWGSK
jgi:hypothetical protein